MKRFVSLLVLGLFLGWGSTYAQPTPEEVYKCFAELGVSDLQTLQTAFAKGFADKRITPDTALRLCQRLKQTAAPISLREGVLQIIGRALMEELPVTMLIDKTFEGLTKGIPLDVINDDLLERKTTLSEVKTLLASKGVTINLTIRFGMVTLKLTLEAVDTTITEAAGALEDYVRGGGKLEDANAIKSAVQLRLLRNPLIPQMLTSYIDQVVSAAEWAQIAQNIAKRLKK
uniref:DUF1400 domain-containing protein n=2 Tax=Candidatus Bipolaricaulota TaxID=67810 RepID=H5SJT9_9BACT|nr:hypothetical protein HGMM_F37H05C18 [uncultured Acetothermia bacterium]BAL59507.1 hypothetical protein HGMM_OP4C143 [Candidatus Acetothermum autotrophicum]